MSSAIKKGRALLLKGLLFAHNLKPLLRELVSVNDAVEKGIQEHLIASLEFLDFRSLGEDELGRG